MLTSPKHGDKFFWLLWASGLQHLANRLKPIPEYDTWEFILMKWKQKSHLICPCSHSTLSRVWERGEEEREEENPGGPGRSSYSLWLPFPRPYIGFIASVDLKRVKTETERAFKQFNNGSGERTQFELIILCVLKLENGQYLWKTNISPGKWQYF